VRSGQIHITPVAAFVAAIVAGLINALVRPLLVLLTLPITVLTLGLFLLVLNAALLVPGFQVGSFWAALLGGILYWLGNLLISMLFERRSPRQAA